MSGPHDIKVKDSATFFEVPNLSLANIDSEVLTSLDAETAEHGDVYTLLRTMDLAMSTPRGQISSVADLVVQLFRVQCPVSFLQNPSQ